MVERKDKINPLRKDKINPLGVIGTILEGISIARGGMRVVRRRPPGSEMRGGQYPPGGEAAKPERQALEEKPVDVQRQVAKELAEKMRNPNNLVDVEKQLQQMPLPEHVSIEVARAVIKKATAGVVKEHAWLQTAAAELVDNDDAASFLASLAKAGPEALNDPRFLWMKAAQFSLTTQGKSSKLTQRAFREAHAVLHAIRNHIGEMQAAHTDFDMNDWTLNITLLPEMRQSFVSSDTSPLFYKGNIPEILEIQQRLTADPLADADPTFWDEAIRMLRNAAGQPGNAENIDEFQFYIDRARARLKKTEPTREQFSSIILTIKEGMTARTDPERIIELYLRTLESSSDFFPETGISRSMEQRLTLLTGYIASDQYKEDVLDNLLHNDLINQDEKNSLMASTDLEDEINKLRNRAAQDYCRKTIAKAQYLSNKVTYRTGAMAGFGMIRTLADAAKVQQRLMSFGTKGLDFVMRENAGMVGVAYRHYAQVYRRHRFDKDGDLAYYSAEVVNKIHDEVVKDLEQDMLLYNDRWHKAFGRDITKDDIRAVARTAQFLHTITQQDIVATEQGLTPYQVGGYEQYKTASTAEFYLFGWDLRWFLRKWKLLKPGQKAMWENACRAAAFTHGLEADVKRRLDEAWGDPVRQVELKKEAFHIQQGDSEHVIRRKIQEELQFDEHGRRNKGPFDRMPRRLEDVTKDQVEDRLLVNAGEDYVANLMTIYDFYSSGYISPTFIYEALWERFGDVDSPYNPDDPRIKGRGLGFKLRIAGSNMLGEENHHDVKHIIEHDLIPALQEVADYRPQELTQFLYADGKHKPTIDWVAREIGGYRAAFGTAVTHHHELYREIDRRLIAINDKLVERGLNAIKYSDLASISGDQRDVVKQVLNILGGDTDDYLSLVNKMSQHVGRHIEELARPMYHKIYRRVRWIDDAYFEEMKDPWTKFSHHGKTQADSLVRTWGDNATGLGAYQEVRNALTPNEQEFIKAIKAIDNAISSVYGVYPWAARGPLYLIAGYGKTMKADWLADLLFLGEAPNVSGAKRIFGPNANALELNELEHFIEENGLALGGKLSLVAPHTAHKIEQWLGIYLDPKLGGDAIHIKIPLYLYRVRLWIALAGLLIAFQAGKGAEEELTGSSSGGGHH